MGVVTTPLGTSLFHYRFTWEQTFFAIYSPKDMEVSSPEVCGSVSEKIARKKIWRLEKPGRGGNPPR